MISILTTPINQQSGMSNALIGAPQNLLTQINLPTGITSNFSNVAVNGFNSNQSSGGVLRFPADTPKYYITFSISSYSRQDLNTVGTLTSAGYPSIILPVPRGLDDNLTVNWGEVEVGTITGSALNIAAPGIQQAVATGGINQQTVNQALNSIGQASKSTGVTETGALAVGSTIDAGATAGVESILGVSPNQFVTLLMKGPQYKRWRFEWILSGQNLQENDQIREIRRTFQNAMSPIPSVTIGNAPILWAFPCIFSIALYPNSLYMTKFKPAVCNAFQCDFFPAGRGAFMRDPTGSGTQNAPESVRIVASFIELEFWTAGNFSATNDPTDVYGNTSGGMILTASSSLNYPSLNNFAGVNVSVQGASS